ncbi:NOL1/NOP2/sun family putative RNA methylase [Candidatus Gracilibacteria bacterium]|nr:NOL1/NOP2/sun family putative RNA methylase [Candidatus Gracilibacteria bacterium]
MKQDFLDYIQETFAFSDTEMSDFEVALSRPLKKTLRVNTNKISVENFKTLAKENNWKLSETALGQNMFYIDREDTSVALGNTLEHIAGYFYVQELAASSSPFYLSDDAKDTKEYMILDMSASPGGKTTQLAEYYPNSIIVANEIDKTRMRQLHENTDRLGAKNVCVTNYDGRFFANYGEVFDKILLDAPCSGEGTAYKTDDALKYWNIKNIKRIAKLQYQLIESAFISLKVGGELVYSTCTLNRLENEDILNKLTDTYGDYFRIISLGTDHIIRAWPHIHKTGGFFVVKLIKKESIPDELIKTKKKTQKNTQGFEKVSNNDDRMIREFLKTQFSLELIGKFYTYRNEIYYTEKNIDFIWENFFLYKVGTKIGKIENGQFEPNFFLGTNFGIFEKNSFEVEDENIDVLFKGQEISVGNAGMRSDVGSEYFHSDTQNENIRSLQDGFYQIHHNNIPAGIVKIKNSTIKSVLENRFYRK